MEGQDERDRRIDALTGERYKTPGGAAAAITEVTALINAEIAEYAQAEQDETFAGFADTAFGDRLRRWLNKLEDLLRAIAKEFVALSYTLTISWPLGVSVSLTWPGST
jgi:hypothetical protein